MSLFLLDKFYRDNNNLFITILPAVLILKISLNVASQGSKLISRIYRQMSATLFIKRPFCLNVFHLLYCPKFPLSRTSSAINLPNRSSGSINRLDSPRPSISFSTHITPEASLSVPSLLQVSLIVFFSNSVRFSHCFST